jgi:hypothetical protein
MCSGSRHQWHKGCLLRLSSLLDQHLLGCSLLRTGGLALGARQAQLGPAHRQRLALLLLRRWCDGALLGLQERAEFAF